MTGSFLSAGDARAGNDCMSLPPAEVPGVGDVLAGKDGWTYLPPEIITGSGGLDEEASAVLTTIGKAVTGLATAVTGTNSIILALGRFIPATAWTPGVFTGLGVGVAGDCEPAGNFVSDSGAGFATRGFATVGFAG
jgi:hypothetical protein